jgi:hypothetical protein
LAAALVASPLDLRAQECTATITPAQVQAGQQAVRLNVSFSEEVGELTRLQAADSGIMLAEARDLPRTDLAANAPAPRPIAMGEQRNTWTVYVNTEDARPGAHRVTFVGAEGGCTAQITVAQGGAQPAQPGAQPTQPRQPSAQPGAQPTQPRQPSAQPGAQPGNQPAQPGAQPTQPRQPSAQPGAQPGNQPAQPGAQPTQPRQPSTPPTTPSTQPSPSGQPSTQPTTPTRPNN